MFTPGFKLFFGFSIAAVVAAIVYGLASTGGLTGDYLGVVDAGALTGVLSLGWRGGVGDHAGYVIWLLFAAAAAFIGGSLIAFRDADADAQAQISPDGRLPNAQSPTAPNYWPVVGAFAAAVVIVGLVTNAAIFVAGLILVAVVVFEWMMSAWADRATGDPQANRELRSRIMTPIEIPVLGAAGAAVLVLAFSRLLIAVSKFSAIWVAAGAATIVFLIAVLVSAAPRVSRNVVAGVIVLTAVAVLTAGIISAAIGPRDLHKIGEHDDHHDEPVDEGALTWPG